ncbi:hypothetical protein GCM10010187_47210 [Actinomadura coerulea]|uniref:SLC13 family permease n=1 Tax=Actinomadura coerulea TaxID=46159 RepID=UPI001996D78B|nr:hypothetical protein GCM10010187_47210 [Actinomadura coerulea]
MASSIGGTATLVGDPPNIIIIVGRGDLSFNDFLVNLAPLIASAPQGRSSPLRSPTFTARAATTALIHGSRRHQARTDSLRSRSHLVVGPVTPLAHRMLYVYVAGFKASLSASGKTWGWRLGRLPSCWNYGGH